MAFVVWSIVVILCYVGIMVYIWPEEKIYTEEVELNIIPGSKEMITLPTYKRQNIIAVSFEELKEKFYKENIETAMFIIDYRNVHGPNGTRLNIILKNNIYISDPLLGEQINVFSDKQNYTLSINSEKFYHEWRVKSIKTNNSNLRIEAEKGITVVVWALITMIMFFAWTIFSSVIITFKKIEKKEEVKSGGGYRKKRLISKRLTAYRRKKQQS
jgi:hypothetical protein